MPNYFTRKGLELRKKLIKAQEQKVKAIGKEAGEEAGISCDWHDNFGYEDAKRRLEMESVTLRKLREEVGSAQVIEVEEQSEKVYIGVTVRTHIGGEEKEYTIGAYGESDPNNGMITYISPLGRSLLGMQVGDSKIVNIGGKAVEVEVDEIFPPSYRYHRLLAQLTESTAASTSTE